MADFDLLKTTTPLFSLFVYISVSMMGGGRVNIWTLISNFTQLRHNFKVERPEGWKQRERGRKKLKE